MVTAKEYLKGRGLKNPPLDNGISGGGDEPRIYVSDVMESYSREFNSNWIPVEDCLPDIGKHVIVVTEFQRRLVTMSDTFMGYMDEYGELYQLPEDDSYGWQFNDCVKVWQYAPQPPQKSDHD